jgi:hypothetical protein
MNPNPFELLNHLTRPCTNILSTHAVRHRRSSFQALAIESFSAPTVATRYLVQQPGNDEINFEFGIYGAFGISEAESSDFFILRRDDCSKLMDGHQICCLTCSENRPTTMRIPDLSCPLSMPRTSLADGITDERGFAGQTRKSFVSFFQGDIPGHGS